MNGAGMNSHAHPALGSVGGWFYRWAVGLRLDDGSLEAPSEGFGRGWRRALFAPGCTTDPRLPKATARITSMHGPIEVSWENASAKLHLDVSVPPDVQMRVVIPPHVGGGVSHVTVLEGESPIWMAGHSVSHSNVRIRASCEAFPPCPPAVEILVGSGQWHFVAH